MNDIANGIHDNSLKVITNNIIDIRKEKNIISVEICIPLPLFSLNKFTHFLLKEIISGVYSFFNFFSVDSFIIFIF